MLFLENTQNVLFIKNVYASRKWNYTYTSFANSIDVTTNLLDTRTKRYFNIFRWTIRCIRRHEFSKSNDLRIRSEPNLTVTIISNWRYSVRILCTRNDRRSDDGRSPQQTSPVSFAQSKRELLSNIPYVFCPRDVCDDTTKNRIHSAAD